jgi:hypothetical protein
MEFHHTDLYFLCQYISSDRLPDSLAYVREKTRQIPWRKKVFCRESLSGKVPSVEGVSLPGSGPLTIEIYRENKPYFRVTKE